MNVFSKDAVLPVSPAGARHQVEGAPRDRNLQHDRGIIRLSVCHNRVRKQVDSNYTIAPEPEVIEVTGDVETFLFLIGKNIDFKLS